MHVWSSTMLIICLMKFELFPFSSCYIQKLYSCPYWSEKIKIDLLCWSYHPGGSAYCWLILNFALTFFRTYHRFRKCMGGGSSQKILTRRGIHRIPLPSNNYVPGKIIFWADMKNPLRCTNSRPYGSIKCFLPILFLNYFMLE